MNNNQNLQPFTFNGSSLSYGIYNSEPVFHLNNVAEILGIKNPRMSIDMTDTDYVIKLNNSVVSFTYNRKLNNRGELFLTEAGLYYFILLSRKPSAVKFQKWVTKEVLPSIRKSGVYSIAKQSAVNVLSAGERDLYLQIIDLQQEVINLYKGRKSKVLISEELALKVIEDFKEGYTTKMIAGLFGLSLHMVNKIIRESCELY